MVPITVVYEGDLHTRATHGPSGHTLVTDAPVDNQGKGEAFSPTDLAATSMGTCMLTIMGIQARRLNVDLAGARCQVNKHMVTAPVRRIGKLELAFELPAGVPEQHRPTLIRAAEGCPIKASLHPDVQVVATYDWTL